MVRLPAATLFVEADIGLLERVLDNLILNAFYHTPPEGIVALELRSAGQTVTFAITDTGQGIAPEDLPRIFDRFYRGSSKAKDDGNHLGLGLAIAKRIVELHGSTLWVASKLHRGTQFGFDLPIRAYSAS